MFIFVMTVAEQDMRPAVCCCSVAHPQSHKLSNANLAKRQCISGQDSCLFCQTPMEPNAVRDTRNAPLDVLPWPRNPPDPDPMEQLWDVLEQ